VELLWRPRCVLGVNASDDSEVWEEDFLVGIDKIAEFFRRACDCKPAQSAKGGFICVSDKGLVVAGAGVGCSQTVCASGARRKTLGSCASRWDEYE
jgi:hypothetical protein